MEPVSIVLPGGTKNGPNGSNKLTSIFTFLIETNTNFEIIFLNILIYISYNIYKIIILLIFNIRIFNIKYCLKEKDDKFLF